MVASVALQGSPLAKEWKDREGEARTMRSYTTSRTEVTRANVALKPRLEKQRLSGLSQTLSLPVEGEVTAHEPTFDLKGGEGQETASHLGYT